MVLPNTCWHVHEQLCHQVSLQPTWAIGLQGMSRGQSLVPQIYRLDRCGFLRCMHACAHVSASACSASL